MEEEDHFTLLYSTPSSHCGTCCCCNGNKTAAIAALSFSLLSCTHSPHSLILLSLLVPIYRLQWCHQLQLFFNKDGCQLHLFCNKGGCPSQWLVPSICCTLMATNPTLCAIITTESEPWKLEPIYQNIIDICIRHISHIFWHRINQIYTAQVRYILDVPINHDIGLTFHIDTAWRRNTARWRRNICSTTAIFARRGIHHINWRIQHLIFAT